MGNEPPSISARKLPASATGAADQFTYIGLPTVSGVAPTAGPLGGGTTVVITGTISDPGWSATRIMLSAQSGFGPGPHFGPFARETGGTEAVTSVLGRGGSAFAVTAESASYGV